jgi:hypothetical protein
MLYILPSWFIYSFNLSYADDPELFIYNLTFEALLKYSNYLFGTAMIIIPQTEIIFPSYSSIIIFSHDQMSRLHLIFPSPSPTAQLNSFFSILPAFFLSMPTDSRLIQNLYTSYKYHIAITFTTISPIIKQSGLLP